MTHSHLTIENLCCAYGHSVVLKAFNLQVNKAEIAAILGPSGCGKSTLLRAIAGFEPIQSGRIHLAERTLADGNQLTPPHRRRIGMVFQDHALFPHLTVERNIGFGLKQLSSSERVARVQELLEMIDLPDKPRAMPHELSGGQAQRVALARALAPKPELLLMDEPFASLDQDLRQELTGRTLTWLQASRTTTLLVTHNLTEAEGLTSNISHLG